MLHHLREHELAQVHPHLPRAARPQDGPVPRRRRGSNRQLDEGSLSKCFSTTYHNRSAQRWDTTDLRYYFISELFQKTLRLWADAGSTRAYLGITEQQKLPII